MNRTRSSRVREVLDFLGADIDSGRVHPLPPHLFEALTEAMRRVEVNLTERLDGHVALSNSIHHRKP